MKKLISSKHLESVSDLTLSAPIKQGFIDAFEAVTYETRLQKILDALFRIRATAREHSEIKPFVDTAERIQSLLDFRLTILDDVEPRRLLLSATFDKPFEPYMRLIWDPLGPLLDVIFCNCEGYVTASEHSFEDYLAWVRKSQKDTGFFYAASGISVTDIQYLVQIEKLQREAARRYRPSTVTADNPEDVAEAIRNSDDEALRRKSCQLGMEALVALYKLADFYPPDRHDGRYLLRASQQLLEGWGRKQLHEFGWEGLVADQLAWLESAAPATRTPPADQRRFDRTNIQGGIIETYGGKDESVLHGAMLLTKITDPVKARAFIRKISTPRGQSGAGSPERQGLGDWLRVSAEAPEGEKVEGRTFLNLAFTRHGLLNIGLPQAEYDGLPQEFREGMEQRAGLLGDVRGNHPRNWKLPVRHRAIGAPPGVASAPVEISEVDLIVIARSLDERDVTAPPGEGEPDNALDRIVREFRDNRDWGIELLAVEPMRRAPSRDGVTGTEHFGFSDGLSQPKPVAGPVSAADRKHDKVPLGEIFLGYSNSRADGPADPDAIFDDGSFMVLRKLSQDVGGLRELVRRGVAGLNDEVHEEEKETYDLGGGRGPEPAQTPFITEEELYGKLMGRDRDGNMMLPRPRKDNGFGYRSDPGGSACPFQAHVRRANPRALLRETHGRPTPRILRRGLSYGPAYDADAAAPRGVFFMAFNASIAEQFEVIQRWISGGNSTGVASWQSDPLMGVGQHGDPRTFRFIHKGRTCRIRIPEPVVKLQWGAYLFVPAISGLQAIAALTPDARAEGQAAELEQAARGEEIAARLLALAEQGPEGRIAAGAAWKTHLEDFAAKDPAEKDEASAIWAAIRLYHAGALKVPYGLVPPREEPRDAVLVASKDLVTRVLRDPDRVYSMAGQMARMKQSFGEIFLGMDDGPLYREKSKINDALFAIDEKRAFELARDKALNALAISYAVKELVKVPECKIDLRRHLITPALAAVCHAWFGIPDAPPPASQDGKNYVDPWGWSWEPAETRKPRCPGDYMATSRFCFYPDPIPRVQAFGKSHGQALRKAVRDYFDTLRKPGEEPTGILNLPDPPDQQAVGFLSAVMANLKVEGSGRLVYPDNDELARNVIGVMTGFLPPADGCMRWALYEWIEDKTLPRVQHDLTSCPLPGAYERAEAALKPWLARAIQKRPAPDLLWRTATRDHRLGDVEVGADERIFIGLVSALAEDSSAGLGDVSTVFGGDRDPDRADSPLHACPAQKAAMGTMLGILSALLDSFRIEPLPATMLVKIDDPTPGMKQRIAAAAAVAMAIRDKNASPSPPASSPSPYPPAEGGGYAEPTPVTGDAEDEATVSAPGPGEAPGG